jgi:hypothetical protein
MNMNMKTVNLIKNMVLILLFTGVSACSGFLDEDNKSAITQQNYFTNANQAQTAVNGIYAGLNVFTMRVNYGESPFVSIELPAGQAFTLSQSASNNNMINQRSSSIELVFREVWRGFYKSVANANQAIAKISGINMDEAKKSSLLGEAYFLRAFYYYHLVRLYGEIPLITDIVTTGSPDFYPERSTVADVYTSIINDLKTAENSSLPDYDATGRVCKGMVKSLMASVYLTMAGQPLNLGTSYYTLAAQKAGEVIDGGWYSLFDKYAYLHDRVHKVKGEFILQTQTLYGTNDQGTSGIAQLIIPERAGISVFGDEYGALTVRDEFVQSYEPGDLRAQEQQFFFTQYNKAGTLIKFKPTGLYKYWLEEAAGNGGDKVSDENWTLLRLPEVMLIYAEASNEVSGPTEKALAQIRIIRNRAQLTTPDLSAFTKDSFREFIWKERYHELAFENKSYFDIQRTHMAYDLKNNRFVDAFTFQNESGITFKKQYLLWPIPSEEINTNTKLKPQNEGWD